MAIQTTLKKLGLSEKEIMVYLALIKHGKTKASDLAKFTKINRPTLYNLAKQLVSKGMIAEDYSVKILHYTPLQTENLKNMLEGEKRKIQEKEELIGKAIAEISLITPTKAYPVPKIRFIEEENMEKYLFDNLVKWQKAVIDSDGVWRGFQDHSFVENYEKWIAHSWTTDESKHLNYSAQLFTNESKIEEKIKNQYPKERRQVRFLSGMNFTASVWVSGDYLTAIQTNQHPFYLFEIHDKLLAQNMREVFKKLWEVTNH